MGHRRIVQYESLTAQDPVELTILFEHVGHGAGRLRDLPHVANCGDRGRGSETSEREGLVSSRVKSRVLDQWRKARQGAAFFRDWRRDRREVALPSAASYCCRIGVNVVFMLAFGIAVTAFTVTLVASSQMLSGLSRSRREASARHRRSMLPHFAATSPPPTSPRSRSHRTRS